MKHFDVVKSLLEKGADPLLKSSSCNNAYPEAGIWDLLENK